MNLNDPDMHHHVHFENDWNYHCRYQRLYANIDRYVNFVLLVTQQTLDCFSFGTGCVVSREDPVFTMGVRPWIEYILGSMIPFFTILICNVIIIRKLIEARRKKLEMTSHMNDQRTNQVGDVFLLYLVQNSGLVWMFFVMTSSSIHTEQKQKNLLTFCFFDLFHIWSLWINPYTIVLCNR